MSIIEQIAHKVNKFEVMTLRNHRTLIKFEANMLKTCTVAETSGTSVRIIHEGRQGFSASTDKNADEQLVSNAIESAKYGDMATYSFALPSPTRSVKTYDEHITLLSMKDLISIGKSVLDVLLAGNLDIKCGISIGRSILDVDICNHLGLDISYRASPLSVGVEIHHISDDDILILYDQIGATSLESINTDFVHRLLNKLKLAINVTSIRPGLMPVLFSPAGTNVLRIPISAGLNGKEALKGTSPIMNKIGERVFDSHISIIDDGTIDDKFASSTYDAEGTPRKRNILIDNGILKGFIYDLKTASQHGTKSTGNASRGLFKPPVPAFTNFSIEPGDCDLSKMISEMKDGIIVGDVLGLGQGNTISGSFSNPLTLAFKVKNGEIIGRVKGLSLAGNVYNVLNNVIAVSKESEWINGIYYAPWILTQDMNVAGRKNQINTFASSNW